MSVGGHPSAAAPTNCGESGRGCVDMWYGYDIVVVGEIIGGVFVG